MGLRTYDGPAFRLSKTPGELTKAAPMLGEDNEYVYKEILGLSDDEFVELMADGVME
jgi:benzylsuccinate CoA-transferase BbsF subunit